MSARHYTRLSDAREKLPKFGRGRAVSWFSSQTFPYFWAIHGRGTDRKWPLVGSWLHQIEDWSMYQIDRRTTWLKLIGKGPLVRPSLYRYPRLYWAVINCWAFNKVIERFYPELCLLNQPTPRAFLVNWSEELAGLSWATLGERYSYSKEVQKM